MPVQDFDIYHGGAVGPPQGWVGVTTGSGTITYNQDVQGGTVTLSTGTTQDSEAMLYLDSDLLLTSQEGSYQAHLSAISAVTSVVIRVGLMTRAGWAGFAAAGALAAMASGAPAVDFFLHDFDTAGSVSTANWVLWRQLGAAGALSVDSGVAAVTTTTKLLAMIDQNSTPTQYVNGIPTRTTSTSEIPTALVTPGIVISNKTGADRTVTIDMIGWEGRRS